MRAADHLPERFNAAEWFVGRHAAGGASGRVAIVTDSGETTYGELAAGLRRFAGALRAEGVHAGDRVALVLPDGPLFSFAFWGAIAAGAVASPLNPNLKAEHLRSILADCDPRFLVFDPALLDGNAVAPAHCDPWPTPEIPAILAEAEPAEYAPTHRDAFAFILYSSGTTGEPKGVVHLQHDMWVCARTYGEAVLDIGPGDRCFSIAKLFFAYGLGNAQYFPYDAGAACVLYPGRPSPAAVFEQVRRHRPTLFFGVPTAYANMLAAMDTGVAAADFSSVRCCFSAGEALPESLFARWMKATGLEILDGIGSTEICHCFISNRPAAARAGSSGTVVPGYEVRLVGEDGDDAPSGEIGDLIVRGDSTMAFYWNKHEATKRTLQGDWIRTGDKYRCDEDGYYWHAGRSDDMLKVGGIWVSPVEVESALTAHPSVLECAVVGRTDDDRLVKAHAFVVVRDGAAVEHLADALKAFARERIEGYKCPRWITFLPELPRTATGKLQRFLLREAAASPGS